MPLTSLALILASGATLPLVGRFPLPAQVATAVEVGQWMDLRTLETGTSFTFEVVP